MHIKHIKTIAALLLLICLVLPMSRCTKPADLAPAENATLEEQPPVAYHYLIPLAEIDIRFPSTYIILLAFIWPFPLWFLKSRCQRKWCDIIFDTAELLFLIFSSYLIAMWTFYFGQPYWGGFIAVASVTVLSLVYLYRVFNVIKANLRSKNELVS